MYRAVLTLLVGLMLSLGGGASALTFKSDGTVVQSDGTVVNSSYRPGEVPSLSKYDEFRVIDFDMAGKNIPLIQPLAKARHFSVLRPKVSSYTKLNSANGSQ
jgi:hypothetical protein